MKTPIDKTLAIRLLRTRERGGYKFIPFIRTNAKRYLLLAIYYAVFGAFLAWGSAWVAFGYFTFFMLGMLMCDLHWFKGQRIGWSFSERVVNWELVKKIADEDSAPKTNSN